MKKFFFKQYLKAKIKLFVSLLFLQRGIRFCIASFYIARDIISSLYTSLTSSNSKFKIALLTLLGLSFLGGGVLIHNVYSQDFSYASQSSVSSLPPTAVQDEFEQFVTLTDSIMQGQTDTSGNHQSGMLDFLSGTESYLYVNNPISITKYAQYYMQTRGFVGQAYAQSTTGTGYVALSPIIPIWEIFRNIAYLIIAIMIVVVGFIIIFGGKYGQTEVTIINSLPKIVFALILITFSYPIAGFVIDLSNLGTNLIVGVLAPQFVTNGDYYPGQYPVECTLTTQVGNLNTGNGSGGSSSINQCTYAKDVQQVNGGDFNVFRLMAPIVNYGQWAGNEGRGSQAISSLIRGPTNIGFFDAFLQGVTFLSNPTEFALDFIMEILIFYWAIRIFILILTSFVRVVMGAMFGPLYLVAYPLNGAGVFLNWFKNLLAPALVFPAVFGLLFIAAIIAFGTDCGNNTPCATVVPSFNDGPWYINQKAGITNFDSGPYMFVDTVTPQFIWNFVALGIIVFIPGVGKQIDEALGSEISRHFEGQGKDFGARAANIARRIPFVGGLIGTVL